jgi:hypothetical protein
MHQRENARTIFDQSKRQIYILSTPYYNSFFFMRVKHSKYIILLYNKLLIFYQ